MIINRTWYWIITWLRNIISWKTLIAILSSFGALWLLVEITTFFFANTKLPDWLRSQWIYFGLIGLIIAGLMRRPQLTVSHKLNGRDTTIEIAIGDLLGFSGAFIVGSNTTFDTRISREMIAEASVQGIFTRRFYGDETQLDAELSACLSGLVGGDLAGTRIGKSRRYPIGTCVRLNPKDRTGYFVAIAHINQYGVASVTFDDLQQALASLWVFVGQRGLKESLVAPVLGTGFGRLKQTREEVIHEMIKSFIAACSEKTFADKLTIVITANDMRNHHISLIQLGLFLQHECQYASFAANSQQMLGTPVDTR